MHTIHSVAPCAPAPSSIYRNSAIKDSASLPLSGHLRQGGRRHDNDRVDFRNIRIVPTAEELLCLAEPYLPPNNR